NDGNGRGPTTGQLGTIGVRYISFEPDRYPAIAVDMIRARPIVAATRVLEHVKRLRCSPVAGALERPMHTRGPEAGDVENKGELLQEHGAVVAKLPDAARMFPAIGVPNRQPRSHHRKANVEVIPKPQIEIGPARISCGSPADHDDSDRAFTL